MAARYQGPSGGGGAGKWKTRMLVKGCFFQNAYDIKHVLLYLNEGDVEDIRKSFLAHLVCLPRVQKKHGTAVTSIHNIYGACHNPKNEEGLTFQVVNYDFYFKVCHFQSIKLLAILLRSSPFETMKTSNYSLVLEDGWLEIMSFSQKVWPPTYLRRTKSYSR